MRPCQDEIVSSRFKTAQVVSKCSTVARLVIQPGVNSKSDLVAATHDSTVSLRRQACMICIAVAKVRGSLANDSQQVGGSVGVGPNFHRVAGGDRLHKQALTPLYCSHEFVEVSLKTGETAPSFAQRILSCSVSKLFCTP